MAKTISTNSPWGLLKALSTSTAQTFDDTEYRKDPDAECKSKINYNLQQVLLVIIQKTTGHPTHTIFANISIEIDKICAEFNIDFKSKTATMEWKDRRGQWDNCQNKVRKKLVSYPGTDIKFFVSLKTDYIGSISRWGGSYLHGKYYEGKDLQSNTNYAEISIYVPQKRILFTEETMQEVLAEGDLLDMSNDIEEPIIKESKVRKKKTKTDTKK
jgi:hypothetical protein